MSNDGKKFMFLVVGSLICVALVGRSIMSDSNNTENKEVAFQGKTQSVMNDSPSVKEVKSEEASYTCSINEYPGSPINLLESIEITVDSTLPDGPYKIETQEIVAGGDSSGSQGNGGGFNEMLPKTFERTFLSPNTHEITYIITNSNNKKVTCNTTIIVE